MVEFALVLPVLLLVLLAILKFGLMFNHYLTLTDAVRAGARQLALGRGSATNPCTAAEQQAANSAGSLNLTVGGANTSFLPAESFSGPETCTNSATAWIQGDQAKFSAQYPCDLSILGVNFWPGGTCMLTASATEAIE